MGAISEPDEASFAGVLTEIARQLKGDRPLLLGLGGAVLVTMIGLFAPAAGRLYAWLVVGLIVVVCLARIAVVARETRRRRIAGDLSERARAERQALRIGDDSAVRRITMAGPHGNDADLGAGFRGDSIDMTAGAPPAERDRREHR